MPQPHHRTGQLSFRMAKSSEGVVLCGCSGHAHITRSVPFPLSECLDKHGESHGADHRKQKKLTKMEGTRTPDKAERDLDT